MDKTKYEIAEVIFNKCPVCKKSSVEKLQPKGFFSFARSIIISCDKCSALFIEDGEYQHEKRYKLDLSESNEKNNYDGQSLKVSEWKRGTSDLDHCIKTNTLPNAD